MILVRRVTLVLVALLVAVGARAQEAAPAGQTLAAVRARGHLICAGSDPLPGFAQQNAQGLWTGFDVDFCRAVAAAVFGDPSKLEFRALSGDARFAELQTGDIDLVARDADWTMRRDTRYAASYVASIFYDGQAFMVPGARNIVSAYQLDNLRVCVLDQGDQLANLQEFAFVNQATYTEVLYEDREDLAVAYAKGLCDAVSAPASWLNAIRRGMDDPGSQRILPERISKSVFGPVVRQGDDQWFKIVQWTAFALIDAEEAGVTSLNVDSLSAAKTHRIRRLLGLEGSFGPAIGLSTDFVKKVVTAVGNYGEIFDRNFGPGTGAGVARGQNALWSNGGLIYAPSVEDDGVGDN
ncbi:MAG TPA: transporter substrate-binding domain-containing protein [Devosia sp.]|nr:transporter substrate-binding domain-containing protein [Devosia sp.]